MPESPEGPGGAPPETGGAPGAKPGGLMDKLKGDRKIQVVVAIIAVIGVVIAYLELRKSSAGAGSATVAPADTGSTPGEGSGGGGGYYPQGQYTPPAPGNPSSYVTNNYYDTTNITNPSVPAVVPSGPGAGQSNGATYTADLAAAKAAMAMGPVNTAQVAQVQTDVTKTVAAASTPGQVAQVQTLEGRLAPGADTITSQVTAPGTQAQQVAAAQGASQSVTYTPPKPPAAKPPAAKPPASTYAPGGERRT
jgi:hypothetical protein